MAIVPASASDPSRETALPFTRGFCGVGCGVGVWDGVGGGVRVGDGVGVLDGAGALVLNIERKLTFCASLSGKRLIPKTCMPYRTPTNPYAPARITRAAAP